MEILVTKEKPPIRCYHCRKIMVSEDAYYRHLLDEEDYPDEDANMAFYYYTGWDQGILVLKDLLGKYIEHTLKVDG